MSVAFITMGKFAPAGGLGGGGGGAPQMLQEEVKPRLLITGVEYTKKKRKINESIIINITDIEVK